MEDLDAERGVALGDGDHREVRPPARIERDHRVGMEGRSLGEREKGGGPTFPTIVRGHRQEVSLVQVHRGRDHAFRVEPIHRDRNLGLDPGPAARVDVELGREEERRGRGPERAHEETSYGA